MSYAELHCKTNFSFLEGASHAEELVRRAAELGCAALAVTDKNSLAGVVRAHSATKENSAAKENRGAKDAGLKLIVGAEITLRDAPSVVLWASDRAAYGRLCRLLTLGRRRAEKGECQLSFDDLAEHADGLIAGAIFEDAGTRGRGDAEAERRGDTETRRKEARSGLRIFPPPRVPASPRPRVAALHRFRDLFSDRAYLLAELPRGPDDARRLEWLKELSRQSGLPLVAAGDVHYHAPCRMVLHDVLTATRHGMTVAEAETASLLFPNAWRHLKSPAEMAAAFAAAPGAVERTLEIAARCTFSLDELKYEYPEELAPHGVTPMQHLRRLTWEGARRRYAGQGEKTRGRGDAGTRREEEENIEYRTRNVEGRREEKRGQGTPREEAANVEHRREEQQDFDVSSVSDRSTLDVRCSMFDVRSSLQQADRPTPDHAIPHKVRELIEHELALIEELRYEAYFLTVWDLVRFAESRGILCQGRGSAANSAVCYCLGVTAVDPGQMDVLFERFVSRERDEAPDIDVDFEHERREEVLQYVYEKYGRERAGMTAEVITYRSRSAVRDVGKALGLSLAQVDTLAKQVEGYTHEPKLAQRCREAGLDPESPIGRRFIYLVNELIGFPRHLSQHVGGMVITRGPLCELVPIENAAMPGRTVIEWNKDDLDDLGILKVDCLALGMLTAIRKCFDLVQRSGEETRKSELGTRNCLDSEHSSVPTSDFPLPTSPLTLASVPQNDPAVYDMICRADTIGVFQIESRGQMSMLPRLKPRCYYDLVIEVAIVRPGPIQGNMVHPYLRRRAGREQVTYPNDAIREVLHKTLGVPIFQEQAMRLAVVAAGFTPGEADQLRRAMGAWRRPGVIDQFEKKLIEGMLQRGLSRQFAEQVFQQIRGFGEYGFPESHAASFARLVYVSAWLKHYYPAAFCAAILNSQPMGFYAPAQLVRDARDHGVEVLPADVNHSHWDCTLEIRIHECGIRN